MVPELDEKLRKQCLHLLYKMCKDLKMLPNSYILQQGSLSVGATRSHGGFAYVSTGDYLGHRVAIKRLRFRAGDLPNRVFKVLEPPPTSYFTKVYFANSGFVKKSLSGSVFLIPMSCLCWEFHFPQILTPSSWSPLGYKMGMRWNTPGPIQSQIVWS